jgi:hypothetical protein
MVYAFVFLCLMTLILIFYLIALRSIIASIKKINQYDCDLKKNLEWLKSHSRAETIGRQSRP